MAKGNLILISNDPRGRQHEGIVSGALQPGIVVQMNAAAGLDSNGRATWEPYNTSADGEQRLIAVLLEDWGLGKPATSAYVDGDRCFVYFPLPGDELNMLLLNIAGTADDHPFGEVLMVNDGDGKLVVTTGSPESEAFVLMEAVTDPTADTLAHCMFTGY